MTEILLPDSVPVMNLDILSHDFAYSFNLLVCHCQFCLRHIILLFLRFFIFIFSWTGLYEDFPFPCAFLGAFRRETEVVKLLLYPSFPALSIEVSSTNQAIFFESTTFSFRIRLSWLEDYKFRNNINMWTGTFLNPEKKKLRFQKYPDTSGRALSYIKDLAYGDGDELKTITYTEITS